MNCTHAWHQPHWHYNAESAALCRWMRNLFVSNLFSRLRVGSNILVTFLSAASLTKRVKCVQYVKHSGWPVGHGVRVACNGIDRDHVVHCSHEFKTCYVGLQAPAHVDRFRRGVLSSISQAHTHCRPLVLSYIPSPPSFNVLKLQCIWIHLDPLSVEKLGGGS